MKEEEDNIKAEEVQNEEVTNIPNIELGLTEQSKEQLLTKFNPYDTINSQMEYAKILLSSGALPIQYKKDKPEAVVLAANYGRELGFSFIASLKNIYFVNGNPSISTQAMVALLLQKGVVTKTLKDFELVTFKDKNGEEKQVYDPGFETDPKRKSKRTTIRFYRKHPILGIIIEEDISYTTYEATQAGAYANVWLKFPHLMLWYRVYSFGAKRIASDLLNGLTSTEEMLDAFKDGNIIYNLDSEGNMKLIEKNT